MNRERLDVPAMVIHLPHSSAAIPQARRFAFHLSDADLQAELVQMTDHCTDRLFVPQPAPAVAVVFPVSRLVVDPERFEADESEIMSRKGMGVIYTRTSNGSPLRDDPSAGEREALLEEYYRPHHARLTAAVAAALAAHDRCLLIDAHSFPSRPLPYEFDQGPDRPDICLGTDVFHTPKRLLESAAAAFRRLGWSVAVDRPFAGTLVPMAYYRKDQRVFSIMIEVNRRLYLDEPSGLPLTEFESVRTRLLQAIGVLEREIRRG